MTCSFRMLNARDAVDREEWLTEWSSWSDREVMAHPAYVELFARPTDEVCCAVGRSPTSLVMFPFMLRRLAAEPWTGNEETGTDIVTSYGYGGPYTSGASDVLIQAFWDQFDDWAEVNDAVCAFARLPLFGDPHGFRGETVVRAPNVVRSLDLTPDELWRDYAHKVRKNVKRAREHGLTVEFDHDGTRIDEFLGVYYATLDRRHAHASYYFDREFFQQLLNLRGHFVLVFACAGARVVSTELVLLSALTMYSFLGGTLAEAYTLRPNDLLKHAVCEWGIAQGKRRYVLGGGREGRDGIFNYKRAFAPGGEVAFRVGMRTYNEGAATRLVRCRSAWEQARGTQWKPDPQYFPAYRS